METPKPMAGTWTLTAPDGSTWKGDSPLRTVAMEQRERVPAKVALQRIYAANDQPPQQHILDQIERCRTTAYAAGHYFAQHAAHSPAFMTQQAQDEALLIHLIEEYAAGVRPVEATSWEDLPDSLVASILRFAWRREPTLAEITAAAKAAHVRGVASTSIASAQPATKE